MTISIADVTTTSVSDGQVIAASTENANNNALKNKINEIIDALTDLTSGDIAGSTGDATYDNFFQDYRVGCYVYRIDGTHIGVTLGECAINKKTRQITTEISSTFSVPDNGDWLDVWLLADAVATVPTASIVDSGTTPGGSSNPGTNGRLIGSIYYEDGTALITKVINYLPGEVVGWGSIVGTGAAFGEEVFTHGVTFKDITCAQISSVGETNSSIIPVNIPAGNDDDNVNWRIYAMTTTNFKARYEGTDTVASTEYLIYGFSIQGAYS